MEFLAAILGALAGCSIGLIVGTVTEAGHWARRSRTGVPAQYRGKRYCVVHEDEYLDLRKAKRDLASWGVSCKHQHMEFYAATCAEQYSTANLRVGVTARCPTCRKAWSGDVVTGGVLERKKS